MSEIITTVDIQSQESQEQQPYHKLANQWVLWAHLPHDTDWSIKSYIHICEFDTVESAVSIIEILPPTLVINCMLFLMKKGIQPIWEHERNRKGGCFSYKIVNKDVSELWKHMSYILMGETLSDNESFIQSINGITISPKKNFCILKVWTATCNYQDASIIKNVLGVTSHGCLFKKHNPEY